METTRRDCTILISGCPRSRTSLFMNCLRVAFGNDRIFGERFPMEPKDWELEQEDHESDTAFEWRQYIHDLTSKGNTDKWEERREKAIGLNPNGFYESIFVSRRGMQRHPRTYSIIDEFEQREKPTFVKVVSQGLGPSDPKLINKIVYLLRDPRAIADSQKNLFREWNLFDPNDGEIINFWKNQVVKSPRAYIESTLIAARWFKHNPDVPVLFVDSDELVSNPNKVLSEVAEFLGEGDFTEAKKLIDPNLVRSITDDPEILENPYTQDALDLHALFVKRDWEGVEKYTFESHRRLNRETRGWICARAMHPVNEFICEDCVAGRSVKTTLDLMGRARTHGIDWENRPCGYLSAHRINGPLVSRQETIENNHWKDFDRFKVDEYLRVGGGIDD